MMNIFNGIRLILVGGITVVLGYLFYLVSDYRAKYLKSEGELQLLRERYGKVVLLLEESEKRCNERIDKITRLCREEANILKEEIKRQKDYCKELLDRKSRLDEKLDEIRGLK